MTEIKTIFDFQARVGLTKHLGSLPATRQLISLCQILPGFHVLDVGSGAGRTPILLAKEYEVTAVGVDIHPGMVETAKAQAYREGVEGEVSFRLGDAQDLPFDDNSFDAVIVESVTAFPPDKQKAVNEYKRVVRPGGYVGMNETTYLQADPPAEIWAWASQDLSMEAEPLTSEEWQVLMKNAGLQIITARLFPLDIKKQASLTMKRYGFRSLMRTWSSAFGLYLRHPETREIFKGGEGGLPNGLMDYLGYGLYVGRKPDFPRRNRGVVR